MGFRKVRWSLRKALGLPWQDNADAPPVAAAEPPEQAMRISALALGEVKASGRKPMQPWAIPEPAQGVLPRATMAMDWQTPVASMYAGWAIEGAFTEGLAFLGFPYLAELSQRPEYRQIVKKYAGHMTRKWISLVGGSDTKRARLEKALVKWRVRETFREVLEHDGYFGRGQIFIDVGNTREGEVGTPLTMTRNKLYKKLVGLRVIEPNWSYPGQYESADPLAPDFYKPRWWYVNGKTVHASRIVTVIGREMPDILKPAYAFAGLSRTQMAKPYVENWIRTRQSVSDLIHSFTVWVLSTNMDQVLKGVQTATGNLLQRVAIFNEMRDNAGAFVINKETETFANVSTSLASLDKLQVQALEQICVAAALPVVEFCGTTPSGLNASSDGEIRTMYANMKEDQERMLRDPLKYVMDVIQLSEFGAIDPQITFDFVDLWEISEVEKSTTEKTKADIDAVYVDRGIVTPDEARERVAADTNSPYHGVDLSGPAPEPEGDDNLDDDDNAGAV